MLHLILGRAGSGKTEYLYRLAETQIRAGGTVTLLVPEQGSFDCERAMLHRLGPQDVRRAEVLSFTRLGDQVGRAYGGFAGRRLDDTGRALFMSLALEQVRDRLVLYRKSVENGDFIGLLLGMSAACKMGAVAPDKLAAAAAGLPGALRSKTEELALILDAYDALVAESYLDPLDDLSRLAQQLHRHPFFDGRTVLLDAFKGFTAQEFEVLDAVIAQSADCWISLCMDGRTDTQPGALFANVRKTARRLIDCAHRHGVPVAVPVVLEPGARFRTAALAAVEAHLFRSDGAPGCADDGSVRLVSAANKYEESAWIAAEIHRLVREEGYRWRDFTVIVRREDDYAAILDRALAQAGIPCFLDTPADVTSAPLMAYTLAALDAANARLESDALFRCLKTGLFPMEPDDVAELENYALLWAIDREAWDSEWKNHPRGFAAEWTDDDRARLERLNGLRCAVAEPLMRLRDKMNAGGTGAELARAVYEFLTETQAADRLHAAADALALDGEPDAAADALRLWDLLMALLDQTALVLRAPLDGRRYGRLLELAIQSAKLGELPQSLDEVTVGGADRTRPSAPRVVFLAGAVQGVFPAATGGGGLFTDHERRVLADRGLEIARSAEEQTVEEQFLAYSAACSPSERLVISSYGATSAGEGMLPSELATECRRIFPAMTVLSAAPDGLPETEGAAFAQFAAHYGENSVPQATLHALFDGDASRRAVMASVGRAASPGAFRFADPAAATALFGARMTLSPSRIETFAHCPFQYFCRYGMDAQERRPARMDALEYGTLIHFLLEHMVRDGLTADEAALRPRVHALLDEYLAARLGGADGKSERFLALYRRFEDTAVQLLQYIAAEQAQSQFAPEAFELTIGRGGDVPPVHIPLPDGGSIEIAGKIDRVDCYTHGGETFVRVIDYKTGAKKFALSDVLYGINMQMLLYLMTLQQNGLRGRTVQPAGVLYLPARTPRINADHLTDGEARMSALMKEMKMNGMVLRDDAVIRAMDAAGDGLFIPVKRKADGTPDAYASLYTMEQFGQIARHMQQVVRQMGAQLHAGRIPAVPVGKSCEYCSFAAVCGHEPNDPVTEVPAMTMKNALAALDAADGARENGGIVPDAGAARMTR